VLSYLAEVYPYETSESIMEINEIAPVSKNSRYESMDYWQFGSSIKILNEHWPLGSAGAAGLPPTRQIVD